MNRMSGCTLALATAGVLLMAAPADAQDPYTQPDDSWISISGTVSAVVDDAFMLNYGDGVVTVEMDDGDRDADAYVLEIGDRVTVTGMVDDDLFENTTIEAASVYVEDLGTYFYASAFDEEDSFVTVDVPVVVGRTVIQGWVTEVRDEEFTLSTGLRQITVEVEDMAYNPLDDEGYQKVEAGDLVTVTGEVDYDLFEGRDFVAETVTILRHSGS